MRAIFAAAMLALTGSALGQSAYYCEASGTSTLNGRTERSLIRAWIRSADTYKIVETGGALSRITISRGADVWYYDPRTGRGYHQKRSPAQLREARSRKRPIGHELPGALRAGARKAGQQTLGGVKCDLYTFRDALGLTHRLWVIPGPEQLTKRRQVTGSSAFSQAPGAPMTANSVNRVTDFTWKPVKSIAASHFEIPAGIAFAPAPVERLPQYAPPAGGASTTSSPARKPAVKTPTRKPARRPARRQHTLAPTARGASQDGG